ncbi:MAG: type I phosphomannose isomerase catalytic subunit [Gemmataceae bacterium]
MVWGGRGLGDVLNKPLPTPDAYGEAWEISDHGSHHSVVASGPAAGRTLRQLMQDDPAALVGDWPASGFPWLIKYLDCHDWLSVQVHPDEDAVLTLWPGENSKTEAWFVLDVRPGGRVFAGLKPGVDAAAFAAAMKAGTVADCLHSFEPKPGDCLFLPAGTVHAVGGGVLIAEVQQSSDATFRLFDWNRVGPDGKGRTLHVDQGLASIDWSAGPVAPTPAQGYGTSARPLWQPLVRCRYFELSYVRQTEPFTLGGSGRMQAVMALHGEADLDTPDGPVPVRRGQTVLLPAAAAATWVVPRGPLGLLVSALPPLRKAA